MPETPIIRGRTSSQRSAESSAGTLPALRVRFYKRMRPHKVYPVQVGWKSRKGGGEGGPVQVRLIMAGAQVVPAEQTLDPGDGDARVTFYVTPLAKGWLRGERVEVLQNGRKVGELRTAAKVTTQRMTLALLLLTFLVPWLLNAVFGQRLVEEVKVESKTRTALPTVTQESLRKADESGTVPPKVILTNGEVVEHRIRAVSPEVLPPVREHAGEHTRYLTAAPEYIGLIYTWAYIDLQKYNIPYYAFWVLLLLTLLSWFWHREKRRTRVGQPIEVTA